MVGLVNFWGQPKRTRGKDNNLDSFLHPSVLSPESQLGHHLGQASCSSLRAPGSRSHLIPLRSCFRAGKARRPGARWSWVGQGSVPPPPPRTQKVGDWGQTDRQTDTDVPAKLPGGVWEGAESPGRGGAVKQSSASRPLQRLGLWGDTKSSRSVTSAWRRVSNPGRRGWRGGWKAPPEAKGRTGGSWAAGGDAATLPAPPRNPRREKQAAGGPQRASGRARQAAPTPGMLPMLPMLLQPQPA